MTGVQTCALPIWRVLDWLGIDRAVLVQPTYYATDNRLLLDVLCTDPGRFRGVVQVEDDVTDEVLDGYHEAGVRAIRLDLFARADQPLADLVQHIKDVAERTRPRGWHLQFYSPGPVVRALLPFLADFDDTFVIDHMGYMKESDGLTREDFDRLLSVVDNGRCYVKLSGPYRVAGDKPLSSVGPLGRALVAARPDRLVWGSDWPHLPNGQRDTGELLNLVGDWATDETARRLILVDNPARLFYTN